MEHLFVMILFALILSFFLLLVMMLVSMKMSKYNSKNSPFECGFLPKNVQRGSFSVQFFMIALVFLIFDVEVIILFPMILSIFITSMIIPLSMFILILMGGLMLEWSQSSLEWRR